MRILHRALRLGIAVVVATAGMTVVSSSPAFANTDTFLVCGFSCDNSKASGSITWHNRTATIQGSVIDRGVGTTGAKFSAMSGGVDIDIETRTADDDNPRLGPDRSFKFTIGDTDRVGGFDTLHILLCVSATTPSSCWAHWEYRDY